MMLTGGSHEDSPSEYASAVEFENVVSEGADSGASAMYSLDYFTGFAKALKKAKVNSVTVRWADEMPMKPGFERAVDDEVAYSGEFMIAPRIQSEGRP
jgi:ABC-type branched-subunit amino acid transport system substrate-binding protein